MISEVILEKTSQFIMVLKIYGILVNSNYFVNQGPVVQSIVSLTSSLRDRLIKCFTT